MIRPFLSCALLAAVVIGRALLHSGMVVYPHSRILDIAARVLDVVIGEQRLKELQRLLCFFHFIADFTIHSWSLFPTTCI